MKDKKIQVIAVSTCSNGKKAQIWFLKHKNIHTSTKHGTLSLWIAHKKHCFTKHLSDIITKKLAVIV